MTAEVDSIVLGDLAAGAVVTIVIPYAGTPASDSASVSLGLNLPDQADLRRVPCCHTPHKKVKSVQL